MVEFNAYDLLNEFREGQGNGDLDSSPEEEQRKAWTARVHALKASRYRTDTHVRIGLAVSTQLIIISWVVLIFQLIFCNSCRYHVSDTVICALLGAATAHVVGLAIIVLNGFFKYMNQDVDLDEKRHNE